MSSSWWMIAAPALALAAVVGCELEDPSSHLLGDDPEEEIWDDCYGSSAAGGGSSTDGPTSAPGVDPGRLLQEADVVQMEGSRLYALSRDRGLNLIDVEPTGKLLLVGHADLPGMPMEMYVRDGLVVALIAHGTQEEGRTWVRTFDASVPSDIVTVGHVELDGHFSDSRMRGEVLYVASFEPFASKELPKGDHLDFPEGYEVDWALTTVSSLRVAATAPPELIDQKTFGQKPAAEDRWPRAVMTTETRMYVTGVELESGEPSHSTIQVIDITDPSGALVAGAKLDVDGLLLSRWQLDEHMGVLRVVSQPGGWSAETPRVQTFSVLSSQEVVPLGSLDLSLPAPESLRSVRFDGGRAYAITAQGLAPYDPTPGSEAAPEEPPVDSCGPSCDPLIVIDLEDPAEPKQLGSLEMPGWVFHMVPRGDQLLALGFEATYPLGPLSVSLFDVSDGNQPTMVDRVTFGGEWTGLSEDQNRIHKSFSVLDDLGLLLVPYGWWVWQADVHCEGWSDCGGGQWCWDEGSWAQSGAVQLVDFDASGLTLRGSAQLDSWTLRSLLHDGHLLAVSNEEVQSFDISDRDAPTSVWSIDF